MKKGILALLTAAASIFGASAGGNDDPVLMTIDKKQVRLSEFEYLYQKNNAQQTSVQPVDDYLRMFIDYKLKVAEAEEEGIADTPEFKTEFEGYKRDLAEPYLTDEEARQQLLHSIYDRLKEEVSVSHIMSPDKHLLDSLRTEILAGRLDYAEAARANSIDRQSAVKGGSMGYITAGRFPYTFEDAAYETPVGQLSEVIQTPFGYHLVRPDARRPAQGSAKVQHILKLTYNMSAEEAAVKKAEIDSLYNLIVNEGADFTALARENSEDPGSAASGGIIDWFTTGQMVPEFEAVSFALNPGEVSEPFATSYGYHIVRSISKRGIQPYEELEDAINGMISRDERQYIPMRTKTKQLRERYNTTINSRIANEIISDFTEGKVDSAYIELRLADKRKLVTVNGKKASATVADLFNRLGTGIIEYSPAEAESVVNSNIEGLADDTTLAYERENLVNENADYRNLLNEYRDGMLLFEISDRNVWSKSKADSRGLEEFFNTHKADYANWESPKFKGYIIFSTSDSILTSVRNYLLHNAVEPSQLTETLRSEFGRDIKVERVLAAKGENAITDYLGFGGTKPEATSRWAYYFPYDYSIAAQPEEVADVRGPVTTDYQKYLEENWLKQLHESHKVNINNKVYDRFKQSFEQQ